MKYVIVGTAGHIDHGKTALVRALTGIDADRLKEEKLRGITIDIGFADLAIDDYRFGFVDVPGHERFVKNMLAGAHGLDLVMLVVAADESIMPQTREHFDICRLLRVKSGLVALTKSDTVDAELLELVRAEVEDYVRDSFLDGTPIIPVSSKTGEGIDELRSALARLAEGVEPKNADALPRLPVDRAFTIKGFGTVVTGTLVSGEFRVGDEVELLPSGLRTRVRNLQVHGSETERALAGQRTAINLQGITTDDVERGMVLVPAGRLRATSMLDARLHLLGDAPRPLTQRARVRFHHGTAEVMARTVILEPGENAKSEIEPGSSRLVQFRLESPVAALPGDRFIIRSYSPQITIGGGTILDLPAAKHRSRDSQLIERLRGLEDSDLTARLRVVLEMSGEKGMGAPEIAARTGATDSQVSTAAKQLVDAGLAVETSASPLHLISTANHDALAGKMVDLLDAHHRRQPLSLGLGREEVRERIFRHSTPEVFRSVVNRLVERKKLVADRDTLRLGSHRPALTESETAAKSSLEQLFKQHGLQAMTLDEAARAASVPSDLARKLYNLLTAEGSLVKIGDMVFHSSVIEELKSSVRAQKGISPRIDVAAFKKITGGLTRKYAIPLLEFLDRERVTRRVGNEREII